jgi:hypothetical protein
MEKNQGGGFSSRSNQFSVDIIAMEEDDGLFSNELAPVPVRF